HDYRAVARTGRAGDGVIYQQRPAADGRRAAVTAAAVARGRSADRERAGADLREAAPGTLDTAGVSRAAVGPADRKRGAAEKDQRRVRAAERAHGLTEVPGRDVRLGRRRVERKEATRLQL